MQGFQCFECLAAQRQPLFHSNTLLYISIRNRCKQNKHKETYMVCLVYPDQREPRPTVKVARQKMTSMLPSNSRSLQLIFYLISIDVIAADNLA